MTISCHVLMICGSLRDGSTNSAMLETARATAGPDVNATVYGGLAQLPHFNPDDDREPLHPAVAEMREQIAGAGAVLISTPEYAGALPGSFKNLLDWTIGGGQLYEKPVAWINVSTAPTGAADAHASLRKVLGYAGAKIVEDACAQIPVARQAGGEDGLVHDEALRRQIDAALGALVAAAVTES